MRAISIYLALTVALTLLSFVLSHGVLTYPAPRQGTTNFNVGTAPCGLQVTAESPRYNFTTGEIVNAKFRIDANHKGYVQLNLWIDGKNYTLADNVAVTNMGTGTMTKNVKLPEGITCDSCVFQWIWVPNQNIEKENYYACSDVRIERSTGNGSMSLRANAYMTVLSVVALLVFYMF